MKLLTLKDVTFLWTSIGECMLVAGSIVEILDVDVSAKPTHVTNLKYNDSVIRVTTMCHLTDMYSFLKL